MRDLLKFIKSSGIYFVGSVLTKLISFLLLPMYTNYIEPSDYGTYDLYNTCIYFLCCVLYLDIWCGIMRFMYEYEGEEKKKPITSGFVIFFLSSTLYTLILIGVSFVFTVEYLPFWWLYGLLMNSQTFVGYIARGYGKNVLYTSAGLAGSITTIAFNIILLVYCHMDYSALIIASCIGFATNISIVLIGVKLPNILSVKNFDLGMFKELFFFSLPLCINSVAYWFLNNYNTVAITYTLGSSANGYYAIASRFGSMITLFTTCFQMAWQELAYSKSAKENNLSEFYSVATNSYIRFLGMGLVMLIPVIYIIFPIMIDDSYASGKELIPIYLMATIVASISTFLGNTFGAIKKNNLVFITTGAGSIVNVLSVHALMPITGVQAAGIALFLGFLTNTIAKLILLRKEIQISIDWKNIGIVLTMFVFVMIIYIKGNLLLNFVSLGIACLATLYVFRKEVQLIGQQLKKKWIQ